MSTSTVKKKEEERAVAGNAALYNDTATTPAVEQAQTAIDTQLTGGAKSGWQAQLDETMDKINNREKFTYDLNGDALYNQYKDRFVNQGKMAMMDTMGQAAALTGGYGNSYAQTAGQQAYQQHLTGLNDIVPDLYSLALQKYNSDTDELYKKADMLYGRQQDAYGNLQSLIAATGMMPTAEQLASAGMTQEEANALKMAYAAENPDKAYRAGIINGDEYYVITGKKKGASPAVYYDQPKEKTELSEEQLRNLAYSIHNERTDEGKASIVLNAVGKGYITAAEGEAMLETSLNHGKR